MGGDDERGGCSVVERWVMAKFTLGLVAAVSFFSLVYSYFSGLWSYNVQFSTLIFSLFAHSLDRKYMFLICNGIVAFLVKNLTFTSSGFVKSAEDSVKHVGDILAQENAAECGEEEMEKQQQEMKVQDEDEDEDEESVGEEKEINAEADVEDESEEDEDEEAEVEEENKVREEEVISDACVSTEELNHKFEEFIRKMKEEIRIEAQQQQQLVAAVPV